MGKFFFIAAMISIIGVFAILLAGLWRMSREGGDNRLKSNKMMKLRVILQAMALLFLALAGIAASLN